ncbi:MAG: hypothetical protein ACHQHP_06045 [Bacteroidia bacterium]
MNETTPNITWQDFMQKVDDYLNSLSHEHRRGIDRHRHHLLAILHEHFPEIIDNPLLIESSKDEEVGQYTDPNSYVHFLGLLQRMKSIAILEKEKLSLKDKIDVTTHFFNSTIVMSCLREHMQNVGWEDFTTQKQKTACHYLTGIRYAEHGKESFYAEALGSAWEKEVYDWGDDERVSIRHDRERLKSRFKASFFKLLDRKINNKDTFYILAFANDTASAEVITPYMSFLKSIGFRVLGVKSAEEMMEF